MEPARFKADVFQKTLQKCEFPSCVVITFQVMAVAWVSAGHPYTVRAVTKGRQHEFRGDPSRAGHPDDPEIGRVLKSAHTRQIRRTVTAPVTEKGCDFWFPIAHSLVSFIF
jgi:hypothetical protein